jgi:hypothetical protein
MLMILKRTAYPENSLSGIAKRFFSGMVLLVLMAACQGPATDGNAERDPAQQLVQGLPGGRVLSLDSVSSEITWTIRQSQGGFMKGIFKPNTGFILMEGSSLAGGFWEGDFFASNRISDSSKLGALAGIKYLKDSIPALFRPGGSRLRMDLRQISRVIPRSEFRSSQTAPDSLFPSHDVFLQAEIADSSGGLRFPMKLLGDSNQVRLSGHYQLNLREFGVLAAPPSPDLKSFWIPELSLDFRLVFRREKKQLIEQRP